MSRDGRTDIHDDARGQARSMTREGTVGTRDHLMDRLTLPGREIRDAVCMGDRVYRLRQSEARILAIVGTFRVVRADDLQPMRSSRDAWNGDLRSLAEQGLIETRTIDVNRQSMAVVVLTRSGKALLEAHRRPTEGRRRSFTPGW